MLVKLFGAAVQGIDATLVTIEVNNSPGMRFFLVGLPDVTVKESHERIISAAGVNGMTIKRQQFIVNLSPAGIRKEGPAYDLPIALGMLAATEQVSASRFGDYLLMGELSLDGAILPMKGALPMALMAKTAGFKGFILPQANAREAAVVQGLKVFGVNTLREVTDFFNGKGQLPEMKVDVRQEFQGKSDTLEFDFSDVKGQETVKRALEVAAAGGHNIIMIGPPGAGKSMMAKRMPTILPPFSLEEALETTKIHSVAGKTAANVSLMTNRPFRAPHHTISDVAMVGGGSFPQPGEISLSHNGILFLDELPEFSRSVLEVMRQPLEDRTISISRAKFAVDYPAGFMLVAAMNPCPCGYHNHPHKPCTCTRSAMQKYINRISGPLLDRIDIHVEITPVPFEKISDTAPSEQSASISQRVVKAREIQLKRYAHAKGIYCNAQMTGKHLDAYAALNDESTRMLQSAMERLSLSARAFNRILKVSRTIADLDESPNVQTKHLSEAIYYRNLDRDI
jgi:magnesium chelatase family protein